MTDIVERMNLGFSAGLRQLAADLNENEKTLAMARAEIIGLRTANAELIRALDLLVDCIECEGGRASVAVMEGAKAALAAVGK